MLDVLTGLALALGQGFQQFFEFGNGVLGLGLRLGFAFNGSVLQLAACFVQLGLGLAALLLQLGQQFLGIRQGLGTGILEVLKQAVGKLLEQMQRSGH